MAVALALLGAWLAGAFAWPGAVDERARDLATGDVSVRTAAALAIAREEPARATTRLLPALADRDAGVRLLAARLLLRRGSPEALAAATAWLTSAGGRDRALGLVALGDAPVLPAEARRAAERALVDGDAPVRVRAIELLAARLVAGQVGPLLRALDDDDAGVRLRAVSGLAAAGEPRVGLALLARLADADRQVRAEAVGALATVGDLRAVPALLRLVGAPASDLRGEAAAALGRLRAEVAVPILSRLAAVWPRDDLARRALAALGEIATPAALGALVVAARAPSGGADARLGFALAGARAVPTLAHELAAGPTTSATLAATVLGELGTFEATRPLVGALARQDTVATAAAAALARLRDPAAVSALVLASVDTATPALRAAARAALGAFDDDRARAALSDGLGRGASGAGGDARDRDLDDAALRDAKIVERLVADLQVEARAGVAARALARASLTRSQTRAVLAAFALSEPTTKAALAPALAHFAAGVAALVATLADQTEAPSARAAIAWGLSTVAREPAVRAALASATADASPYVAENARAALAESGAASAARGARLVAADGTPLPARWARVDAGPISVWVFGDLEGRLDVAGLPAGDVTITVPSE